MRVWKARGGEWPPGGAAAWRGSCSGGMANALADPFAAPSPSDRGGPRAGGPDGGAAAAAPPSRRLSYSPFWRLLAAAGDGDLVALWDVRDSGERGPAAAVRLDGGASWVHLAHPGISLETSGGPMGSSWSTPNPS